MCPFFCALPRKELFRLKPDAGRAHTTFDGPNNRITLEVGGKPYKTVTKTVIVGEGDQAQNCKVSLKITPAGVVTATLTYNTGKKKKGKVVYYKPTCSTVVAPYPDIDPNDPATFNGSILLYFAPSAGNNFPGCSSTIPWK